MSDQPDLFSSPAPMLAVEAGCDGAPPHQVIVLPFPLVARVGRIRDVAAKLLATKSARHAESYRAQVTEALRVNLTGKRVPAELHAAELRQFWQAVDLEVARLLNPPRRSPGGAA